MNPILPSRSAVGEQGTHDVSDPVYRAKAEAAAEKFEAYFITDMLRQMRRSTQALADSDSALNKRTHQDMLDLTDSLMGDALASQRAFGIADAILRQLLPVEQVRLDDAFKISEPTVATYLKGPAHVGNAPGSHLTDQDPTR